MRLLLLLSVLLIGPVFGFSQTTEDKEASYTKIITERAGKIVVQLGIGNPDIETKVRDVIIQQYRSLNQIHTEKEVKVKSAKELNGTDKKIAEEQIYSAMNEANARLYNLHFDYVAKLSYFLNESQIEQVKDGMTYGVLPITYKGYLEMIPRLTDDQKLQIKIWLTEAREHAIDAGTSDEKHKWFGKYKGRINNYLSAAGYDMKKEGEEWQNRIKDAQKKAE